MSSKDNRLNTNAEPTVRLSLEVGSQGERLTEFLVDQYMMD